MAIMHDITAIRLHCHNLHIIHLEYTDFQSCITIDMYLQDLPFGINMGLPNPKWAGNTNAPKVVTIYPAADPCHWK